MGLLEMVFFRRGIAFATGCVSSRHGAE
jgi:hypothetical protein